MSEKLPIHVDKEMESLAGIKFEACAAYYDAKRKEVRVIGEAVSATGKPIKDYRVGSGFGGSHFRGPIGTIAQVVDET